MTFVIAKRRQLPSLITQLQHRTAACDRSSHAQPAPNHQRRA
jgi:hypothetical protein